jgi:hypothetical protein
VGKAVSCCSTPLPATGWVIVYFGQFLENPQSSPRFMGHFFPRSRFCNNFDKKVIGPHFGPFFTNSSGRPGLQTNRLIFSPSGFVSCDGHVPIL